MRRPIRVAVCLAAVFTMASAPAPALGAAPGPDSKGCHEIRVKTPETIVIDGREYGPKDGLKIDNFACELKKGFGEVGVTFGGPPDDGSVTPMHSWGSSYAISTEWASQLGYDGKAKADANVFNGRRYIQVCMWYERPAGTKVSEVVCSNAASTGGSWLSGPVKTMSVWDSLNPLDPVTVFRHSAATIAP